MKTMMLQGEPLELAKRILAITEEHRALHNAFEEKVNREFEEMGKARHEAVRGLTEQLIEASGVAMPEPGDEKPALDLRYLGPHGVAFLLLDDGEETASQLHPAPVAVQ